jgi:hypothetical protein
LRAEETRNLELPFGKSHPFSRGRRSIPTEDLFHVVDVGEPSERETRRLFRETDEQIVTLNKSFGFLDAVAPTLQKATEWDVIIQCLLLSPKFLSEGNHEK